MVQKLDSVQVESIYLVGHHLIWKKLEWKALKSGKNLENNMSMKRFAARLRKTFMENLPRSEVKC